MMRAFACLLFVLVTLSAPGPAAAQRFAGNFPVCLQVWEWGGSSYISCEYRSFEECRASAAGRAGMCLDNPYAPRLSQPGRSARPR